MTTPSLVADRPEASPGTAAAKPIVFVVDDDVSFRGFLKSLIESAGWQSETFASAWEFLSRPRAFVPSCLVLDVGLPDINGLDVQQRLVDRKDMPRSRNLGAPRLSQHHLLQRSRPDTERRTADRWGAAIAGGLLFTLPLAGGFYRGIFDWADVVVALMGVGGIAVAVVRFARTSRSVD